MELGEFAALTRTVIAEDGLDDYLPTVCLPERRLFMVIEGVPSDVDIEDAVHEWCLSHVDEDDDFLVAFAVDDSSFKILARTAGVAEEAVYSTTEPEC